MLDILVVMLLVQVRHVSSPPSAGLNLLFSKLYFKNKTGPAYKNEDWRYDVPAGDKKYVRRRSSHVAYVTGQTFGTWFYKDKQSSY